MTSAGGRPVEARCQERRSPPIGLFGRAAQIVSDEPVHAGPRQRQLLGMALERGPAHAHVGGRIDQELEGEPRPATIARIERDDGGEVAAGAVAANREPAPHRCRDARRCRRSSAWRRSHPRPRRGTCAPAPAGSRRRRRWRGWHWRARGRAGRGSPDRRSPSRRHGSRSAPAAAGPCRRPCRDRAAAGSARPARRPGAPAPRRPARGRAAGSGARPG